MFDLTANAMKLFGRFHGNATGPMLSQAGIGRNSRRRLIENGILEVVHHRVYRIASAPLSLESRCAALCLAYRGSFITGPTGGQLLGLRRMGRDGTVHISVPHGRNIGPLEGVKLRQTTVVEPWHVHHRDDGISIASPARLAFDLAADLTAIDHASVVEQLLHDRSCSVAALGAIGRRLVHPGRPGSAMFVATMANRITGGALESHPEVMLATALRERGIPVVAQVDWLRLPNGKRIRIDLAVPDIRWGIEVDAHGDHFLLEGGTRDRRRDRQCHLIGWQVERVTPIDLADLGFLCDELMALYEARCRLVA